jgi:benzoyl-CoA reductase/2-hydroxyglutaryl-CoA dehydratase subunit BcrC/BadD/HgdB
MAYEEEFNRLQAIIVSDDDNVTEGQRQTAREARDKLTERAIGAAFQSISDRTATYNELAERLKEVVDGISQNQIDGALGQLETVLTDVEAAANGG